MLGTIAVAMSVYKNDKLENLEYAIDSILNQTYQDFVIYLQVDGFVDEKMKDFILECSKNQKVKVQFNAENKGLASRLNSCIDLALCENRFKFLARMDADDISKPDRFKRQVEFLIDNPNVSVVGSDVIEINSDGDELFYKSMCSSHDRLKSMIIRKCPFNHPSVMFRMSVFSDGARYNELFKNTQDYYLWVDLLSLGYKFSNINEPLLLFRVDDDFHSRRGIKKAFNDVKSRIYAFKKLDNISLFNIVHVVLLFLLRISPEFLKRKAYYYFR